MSERRDASWTPDPALPGYVTDGGIETDLIFHHGVELPQFAAFPLLVDPKGRDLLADYYAAYAGIAAAAGAGLFLETPTWRANHDWGRELGGADGLAEGQRRRRRLRRGARGSGTPTTCRTSWWPAWSARAATVTSRARRSNPGRPATTTSRRCRCSPTSGGGPGHRPTITRSARRSASSGRREAGLPVTVGFTVETDGRLPDGTALRAAVEAVDAAAPPDWFVVNCAHPST